MNSNNKRIAQNTLLLYFRLLVTMGVSLFTSRIILKVLGIEDFGIFSLVSGVIAMFGFLDMTLGSATFRFLSIEIGRKDYIQLKKLFSISITSHIIFAIIILILAESIGLWFLNTHLVISPDRLQAANWVYQFALLSFLTNMITAPYNAIIISHEKMNIYAYMSIIEVILKLLIVFTLQWFDFDKLKLYAILTFSVSFCIRMAYRSYCKFKFQECKYHYVWDTKLLKSFFTFSGWSIFGNLAGISAHQGLTLIINMFFGTVVNAAMGIANQVNTAIVNFVSNFQTAYNPQILKTYTSGNRQDFINLVIITSKGSFMLLFILSMPVFINCAPILRLWLTEVPAHTATFCQLMILLSLIDTLSAPLWMTVQANGQIKTYQLCISFITFCNLPLAYYILKIGYPVESALVVRITMSLISLIFRLCYLRHLIHFPVTLFIQKVLYRVFIIVVATLPIPLICLEIWNNETLIGLITIFCISFVCACLATFFLGLTKQEKRPILNMLHSKIQLFR